MELKFKKIRIEHMYGVDFAEDGTVNFDNLRTAIVRNFNEMLRRYVADIFKDCYCEEDADWSDETETKIINLRGSLGILIALEIPDTDNSNIPSLITLEQAMAEYWAKQEDMEEEEY